jgi:hypothetical protein
LIIQLEISPIPHEHTHNNGQQQQPTHFLELLFYFFHWKKVETMLI